MNYNEIWIYVKMMFEKEKNWECNKIEKWTVFYFGESVRK